MSTLAPPPTGRSVVRDATALVSHRRFPMPESQQVALIGLLILEVIVFSALGSNFLSWDNFFEVQRLAVELGLLALAMTPVIVTGGIDLSVGSLMALCAVLLGKMWHDGGISIWAAVPATLAIAALAGCLNAAMITLLRMPPLIVTLGSYSLFRGLAEGITRGVVTYTKFPRSFVFLGNGSVGPVPVQVLLLAVAAVVFWILLHRMTIGRTWSAIGFSPDGARYAGIPVQRRVALAYILSGLCAGLAAIVSVAHVDQAKASAGSGYELWAITAVVLGGTSIFGGRGSILGTLMGLFAIVILQDGLRMADRPVWLASHLGGEIAGIATGILLIVRLIAGRRGVTHARASSSSNLAEEFEMRNSQLAVLSIVILAAALIVTGGNFMLIKSIQQNGIALSAPTAAPEKRVTVAMMPKSKGNSYFVACDKGAEDAAKQFNVDLVWDGPTNTDPAEQSRIVETWINRGVDVIAVAVENREGLSTALKKARDKGIKVVTWDADAEPDARDFFVDQATPQGIGDTLMDNAARVMGGKGEFAIISASLTASNMNEWRKTIEKRRAEKYPDITLVDTRPCDDQKDKAFEEANTLLNSRPNLKVIMAICTPAVPGAAEAVKQSGRKDVKVIGLGMPNENKRYVHEGITDAVILWNTMDLGYLTVLASRDLMTGKLKPGDTSMDGGRLGKIEIQGSDILLGKPVVFTKDNIDQFDF